MEPIHFYKLSRAAQERFVGSLNGRGLPEPILRRAWRPKGPLAWFGASAVSVVLLYAFFRAGFGDSGSALATEGVAWMVVDILLVALGFFGVIRALAILREHKASPFRRGVYVFPVGLIDARSPTLRLYPIDELSNVSGPDGLGFTLTFGSSSFPFSAADPEAAATAKTALDGARTSLNEAGAARDSVRPKALAALDPLQGYANPLTSSERMVPSTPPWARFGWALAAVAGAALGVSLWTIRNAKSDDAMYERALAANDSVSLRDYLEKGSRHKVEVSQVLLPRAELRDAEKVGTVDAIEKFMSDHPKSVISGEAQTALRAAMLVELSAAVQAGTLAALDDFTRRHPSGQVDGELARARHGVYQAALDRYMAQAPKGQAAETQFVQHLIAWVEKKGPRVELHFHRLRGRSLDKADAAVVKNNLFKGAVSFPSHYFEAKAVKPDEDALGAAIVQRFQAAFPGEILALSVEEAIADPDAALPAQVTVPTLFIEHGPAWSGSTVSSKNPRGVFVGLEIAFDASFRMPDDTKPIHLKVDGWHLPNVNGATDADKPEESIYAEMRAKAFDQFKKKLFAAFFTGGT
jgi:hypothetical protein